MTARAPQRRDALLELQADLRRIRAGNLRARGVRRVVARAVAVSVTLFLALAFVLHALDSFYIHHRPATATEPL